MRTRSSTERLERSLRTYGTRAVQTVQIVQELIDQAKEMCEARARGVIPGLSDTELAYYDALEVNDSAAKVVGDNTLRQIARELAADVRGNTTIDWTIKESVRARLRLAVKRILRKCGYRRIIRLRRFRRFSVRRSC